MYIHKLPDLKILHRLAKDTGQFPLRAGDIVTYAKKTESDHTVPDFLALFWQDEVFQSRADFITRCDEVELLLREKRDIPTENLQSP